MKNKEKNQAHKELMMMMMKVLHQMRKDLVLCALHETFVKKERFSVVCLSRVFQGQKSTHEHTCITDVDD